MIIITNNETSLLVIIVNLSVFAALLLIYRYHEITCFFDYYSKLFHKW